MRYGLNFVTDLTDTIQEKIKTTMSKKENKNRQNEEMAKDESMPQEQEQIQQPAENVQPSVEEQLENANKRIEELEDKNLRMMAEFENFRRRTNKEKLELMDTAGERIFRDMLPLIDDFERAIAAADKYEDVEALKEGMNLIYQKFIKFLEQQKVNVIPVEGEDFNTDLHEAVTTFAAGEDKKGKVIDCTQKGYKLGDKVIRYAKVVVGE